MCWLLFAFSGAELVGSRSIQPHFPCALFGIWEDFWGGGGRKGVMLQKRASTTEIKVLKQEICDICFLPKRGQRTEMLALLV